MAKISKSKVTVFVGLDKYKYFDELPRDVKQQVKFEVGEAIVNGIQDYLGSASTPVSGGDYEPQLSEEYKKKKRGAPIANLLEDGDLWDAMSYDAVAGGVEVGIWDSDQAPKAYNHQVGDTLPRRQYLPDENQSFKKPIEDKIKRIIRDAYEASKE